MERITIRLRSTEKAQWLLTLLSSFDFIESIESEKNADRPEAQEDSDTASDEQFFTLAGLWEDRDISLDSIRRQAWPRQTT